MTTLVILLLCVLALKGFGNFFGKSKKSKFELDRPPLKKPISEIEQLKDEISEMRTQHKVHKVNTLVRIFAVAILVLIIVAFFGGIILNSIAFKF